MSFKQRMERSAQKAGSNIVLALDFPYTERHKQLLSRNLKILGWAAPHICAVKLNHHLVLSLGLFDGVQKILGRAHELGLPTIMDAKINDIGNTNRIIAEYYYNAGFDAVIANPFIGWEEGLQPVFEVAQQMNRGVIVLVYMSHKGAVEGYGQTVQELTPREFVPQYMVFAHKALKWKADGAVVGGTYPEKIKEVKAVLKRRVPIYSPGIGAQGGDVSATVKAGANFLIVGRAIVDAKDPAKTTEQIKKIAWQSLKRKN